LRANRTDFTPDTLRPLLALKSWVAGGSGNIPRQLDLMRLALQIDGHNFAAFGYAKSD